MGATVAGGVQRIGDVAGGGVAGVEADPGGARPGALELGEGGQPGGGCRQGEAGSRAPVVAAVDERQTLVPLASQPSEAAVKQTDCGGVGAASTDQVRPPSLVWTRVAAACGPWLGWPGPPATPQPWVGLEKWMRRSGPCRGWPSWRQCWPPSTVPTRTPPPSAHPVEVLTKSTWSSSWAPRQTRAQVRPPLLVVRMVPLPTAHTVRLPTAWTASSRWMRPSGSVVVGELGAGWGGFEVGEAVVDGDGVAGWTAEWAVQPVTAMAAANMIAMTVRTGRMASSPGAA